MSANLKRLFNDFRGDTRQIGRLVEQFGGIEEFTERYIELANDPDCADAPSQMAIEARQAGDRDPDARGIEGVDADRPADEEVQDILDNLRSVEAELEDLIASDAASPAVLAASIQRYQEELDTAKDQYQVLAGEMDDGSLTNAAHEDVKTIRKLIRKVESKLTTVQGFPASLGPAG
jgi:hypothetical protein